MVCSCPRRPALEYRGPRLWFHMISSEFLNGGVIVPAITSCLEPVWKLFALRCRLFLCASATIYRVLWWHRLLHSCVPSVRIILKLPPPELSTKLSGGIWGNLRRLFWNLLVFLNRSFWAVSKLDILKQVFLGTRQKTTRESPEYTST